MVLTAARDVGPTVNMADVTRDVEVLYKAGQGKKGTDEVFWLDVFLNGS